MQITISVVLEADLEAYPVTVLNAPDVTVPLGIPQLAKRAAQATLHIEAVQRIFTTVIWLMSPDRMLELNRSFMDLDEVADVLAFNQNDGWDAGVPPLTYGDMFPNENPNALGEVALCVEQACQQARRRGRSLEHEVAYLTSHACLHLIGYDHLDPAQERRMNAKIESAVKSIGLG